MCKDHDAGGIGVGADKAEVIRRVDCRVRYLAVEEDTGNACILCLRSKRLTCRLEVHGVDEQKVHAARDGGINLGALCLLVVFSVIEGDSDLAAMLLKSLLKGFAHGGNIAVVILVCKDGDLKFSSSFTATADKAKQKREDKRKGQRPFDVCFHTVSPF